MGVFRRIVCTRLFFFLAALAVMGIIGCVQLLRFRWGLNDFRHLLEAEASFRLHRAVRIGSISGKALTGVELRDVWVSNGPDGFSQGVFAHATRARVRYGLLAVLRGETFAARSVKSVELDGLWVFLARNAQGKWNFTDMIPKRVPRPGDRFIAKVTVRSGTVVYNDDRLSAVLGRPLRQEAHRVEGMMEFARPDRIRISARCRGRPGELGSLRLSGEIGQKWDLVSLSGDFGGLNLVAAQGYLPSSEDWQVFGGAADGLLDLLWVKGHPIDYHLRGRVARTVLRVSSLAHPLWLDGDLQVTGDNLLLTDIWVHYGRSSARVEGTAAGLRAPAPQLDLSVDADRLDVASLWKEWGRPLEGLELRMRGFGAARVRIVGTPGGLTASGEFRSPQVAVRRAEGLWAEAPSVRLDGSGETWIPGEGRERETIAEAQFQPFPLHLRVPRLLADSSWADWARKRGDSLELDGEITARLRGSLSNPAIDGHLSAGTVRFLGTTLEDVGADFVFSDKKVLVPALELRGVGGSAHLSGAVDVSGSRPVASFRGVLSGIDLAKLDESLDLQEALKLPDKPLGGRIDAEFAVEQSPEGNIGGAGQLEVKDARLDQWTAKHVAVWSSWTPDRLAVARGEITDPSGEVVVSGSVGLADRNWPLDLRVSAKDVDLAAISSQLRTQNSMEPAASGKAVVSGTVTGPAREPSFSGRVQVAQGDLTVKGRRIPFDLVQADVRLDPSEIAVREGRVVQGAAWLETSGRVADWHDESKEPTLDLAFELAHAPLPPLMELASAEVRPTIEEEGPSSGSPLSSREAVPPSSSGRAQVNGVLSAKGWLGGTPSQLVGEADARLEYAEIEGHPIDRAAARLVAAGEDLSVEQIVVQAGDAVVEGHGMVRKFIPPFGGGGPAAGHAVPYRPEFDITWEANAVPVATVFADLHRRYGLAGTFDARGVLRGPSDELRIDDAHVDAPSLRVADETIRDIRLDAHYARGGAGKGDRVEIASLRAQMASGLVQASGAAELAVGKAAPAWADVLSYVRAEAKIFGARVGPLAGVARTVVQNTARTPYPEESPLLNALGVVKSLGGELSGSLTLSGESTEDLHLAGRNIEWTNASYRGRPLPLFGGSLEVSREVLSVPQFFFYDGRGRLEGQVIAELPDGFIGGHLRATQLDLGRYSDLIPGFEGTVQGRGTMNLVLHGRTRSPVVEGNLVTEGVRVALARGASPRLSNGSSGMEEVVALDRVSAPKFHLQKGHFAFSEITLEHDGHQVFLRDGELPITSRAGTAAADRPIRITVNIPRQSLELLRMFTAIPRDARTGGELEAAVQISGTPSRPLVQGTVQVESGDLEVADPSPFLRGVLKSPTLQVADLNARISLGPGTARDLNRVAIETLRARVLGGQVNLAGFVGLNRFAFLHPANRYDLRIVAHQLKTQLFDLPAGTPPEEGEFGLDHMEARFAYDAEREVNVLRLDSVQAHLGAGQMALSGNVELRPEGGLAQPGRNGWHVVCRLNQVPVYTREIAWLVKLAGSPTGEVPPESLAPLDLGHGQIDGQFGVEGSGPAVVQGRLKLSHARIRIPELGEGRARPTWGLKREDFSFLVEVALADDVVLAPFNVAIRGEGTVSNTLANLVVAGNVKASSGRVSFLTQTWDLKRLDFTYQVAAEGGGEYLTTYSKIDLEAVHWAKSGPQRVEITLRLTGRPDQPGGLTSTFTSRPPKSEHEIFAMLGGVAPGAGVGAGFNLGEMLRPELLASLAGQQFVGALTSQLQEALGFEELTVELGPGGRLGYLSAEKRITSQLALSFRQELSGGVETNRPNFGVVYDVSPQLRLRAATNPIFESQADVLFQIGF